MSTFDDLRFFSAEELNRIFRTATGEAAQRALNAGVSIVGTDEKGKLMERHPDGTVTPYKPTEKS